MMESVHSVECSQFHRNNKLIMLDYKFETLNIKDESNLSDSKVKTNTKYSAI